MINARAGQFFPIQSGYQTRIQPSQSVTFNAVAQPSFFVGKPMLANTPLFTGKTGATYAHEPVLTPPYQFQQRLQQAFGLPPQA